MRAGKDDVTVYGQGPQQVLGESDGQERLVMRPVSEDCLFLKYAGTLLWKVPTMLIIFSVVTPGLDFGSTSAKKLPVVVWIHG